MRYKVKFGLMNLVKPDSVPIAPTSLPREAWIKKFQDAITEDPYKEQCIIAMEILCECLQIDDSKTLQEIISRMKYVREQLIDAPSSGIAVVSAGELFTKFITLSYMEIDSAKSIDAVREILTRRGKDLIETLSQSHHTVSKYAIPVFDQLHKNYRDRFPDCIHILTHSWNRSVYQTLIDADKRGFPMKVYVMEGRPRSNGIKMCQELKKAGVDAVVVPDTTLAYFMEKTDFVLMAAEALTIDGAVIGEVGFKNVATLAKLMSKRVYVTAEIYKFLNTQIFNSNRVTHVENFSIPVEETDKNEVIKEDGKSNVLLHDYTHQDYIEFLITDVGAMSPAQVQEKTNSLTT